MRIIIIVLIGLITFSCANNKLVKDPTNKEEITSKIYTVGDAEFGDEITYAPAIKFNFGNQLSLDLLLPQLAKTSKGEYLLRINNNYQFQWKYLTSVTTIDKEVLPLENISRKTTSCSNITCNFQEIGFVRLSKNKHLSGNNDLKLKLNSKDGKGLIFEIPKEYIQAFIAYTDK